MSKNQSTHSSMSTSNLEERQNRKNQVSEQLLREQKRKGNLTPMQEENLQKQFKQHQDTKEKMIK